MYNAISSYQKLDCIMAYLSKLQLNHMSKAQYFKVQVALSVQEKPCFLQSQMQEA